MISCLVVAIGLLLFVMIDALYNAIKLKEVQIGRYKKRYVYLIVILVQGFAVQSLIKSIVPFKVYKMSAGSMEPTLFDGDHFLVDRTYYKGSVPERKDVVVFRYPVDQRKDFIKRVNGLPGGKIEVQGSQVIVNGRPLEEDYVLNRQVPASLTRARQEDKFGPVVVPSRKLFVLGDNRDHSYDSRFWGFVDISDLKGKTLYIYWARDRGRIGRQIR